MAKEVSAEKLVKDIRRQTRRRYQDPSGISSSSPLIDGMARQGSIGSASVCASSGSRSRTASNTRGESGASASNVRSAILRTSADGSRKRGAIAMRISSSSGRRRHSAYVAHDRVAASMFASPDSMRSETRGSVGDRQSSKRYPSACQRSCSGMSSDRNPAPVEVYLLISQPMSATSDDKGSESSCFRSSTTRR